jgi:hypothetical protein
MIARRDVPIKVILVKNVVYGVVIQKGYLFIIKGAKERRRVKTVKGTRFANGQYQLDEHFRYVCGVFLRFRPYQMAVCLVGDDKVYTVNFLPIGEFLGPKILLKNARFEISLACLLRSFRHDTTPSP